MPLDHECPPRVICPICYPTISDRMHSAMEQTWNAIGADVFQALADGADEVVCKQADVVEMVLDCDRIRTYGNDDSPEFQDELAEFNALPYNTRQAIARLAFPDEDYCA